MRTPNVILQNPTRILLFTGKGGVGKTSLACATAIALADSGKRVLLVSTDPASNLDEVLETTIRSAEEPVPIAGVDRLHALNIDPEAAARAYRERVVAPYRGVLPESAIASIEEQLSGACTVEIAAFDEFTKLLAGGAATASFDHIIFDTAPTGHTLRLLKLPGSWTEFLATNYTGTSCLGPLSGLAAQQAVYAESVQSLLDASVTTVILVSRPDASALREAARTHDELLEAGIKNQIFALNGVFRATELADAAARSLEGRMSQALAEMPAALAALPKAELPLLPFAPLGAGNLRRVFQPETNLDRPTPAAEGSRRTVASTSSVSSLAQLIDDLDRQQRGVVLTMGQGGVGKTTVAAAVAVELASRGHRVHLTTTDPAAHVSAAIGRQVPGLTVSRIDPALETERYSQFVMRKSGEQLDERGRAVLAEDLRSPCTEEIAVFQAFAETVASGEDGFVILDTAPTGHTLLLLDAAEAYHREVLRTATDMPDAVKNLLPRLRDPEFTRVLLVTLPEATPVHEAARLQDDLRRAGIEPFAWVINQSLSQTQTDDWLLATRAQRELAFIEEVVRRHAGGSSDSGVKHSRIALLPWSPEEPVGPDALRRLIAASVPETLPAGQF